MGLITNFLSLKEIFLMSLHGNPIFGVSLDERNLTVNKIDSSYTMSLFLAIIMSNTIMFTQG